MQKSGVRSFAEILDAALHLGVVPRDSCSLPCRSLGVEGADAACAEDTGRRRGERGILGTNCCGSWWLGGGSWTYCALRWLCISFESVAIASVDKLMARYRSRGLTQKINEIPQPGRRYSHRHLLRTLCRRSDSSKVPV